MRIYIDQTISPQDLKRLVLLHAEALPHQCWDETALAGIIAQPHHHIRIAMDEGEASGFIVWRAILDEAELLTIAVSRENRHKGVGSQLLDSMLKDSSMEPVKRCFLEVAEDNAAALRFYQKHGFAVSGRRKRYYSRGRNDPVDALLMQRVEG